DPRQHRGDSQGERGAGWDGDLTFVSSFRETIHQSTLVIFASLMVYRKFSGSVALSTSLPVTLTISRVYAFVFPLRNSTKTILVTSGASQYQQPTGYSISM